jgi:DNA replication ATP-dependent helicase Dna2
MTFLSPLFGVMGRTDYWSPKGIYEFKTGRKIPSKTINTWFSDLIQTIVYMHGLSPSPKAVSKSYVIYSGEGTPVFRKTTLNLDLLQRIYMARNYCYLIQFEGFIPPRRHNKKCSHCFNLKECEILSVFFNNEKNAKSSRFQYLSHFLSLIRLEHLKNRHDFSYLWKLSPQGRVRIGKAINDISFNKKENERFIFRCNNSSELKAGEPVILSKGNPVIDVTTIATIASINRKEISLNSSSSLPEKAYIDAYSSDFSFRRLNKSLYDLILGHKSTHKSQRFIINGKKPTFTHVKALEIDGVDPSQKEAIQLALSANDFCLIQGPAGTGKTYTIAKLVEILLVKGQTILLSAYTNTAVDNMIRKFLEITNDSQARNKIVRLGIEEAIDPEVIDLSLQAKKLEYQDLLKIPIIAATTSTIGRNIYDEFSFDVIIVDEASQMSEPSVLSAVTKGKKFILVGDDKQLPPLVQSTQAEKLGFKNSLFERLRKLWPSASILLRYQYRMHDYLMDFSNIRFYNNSVQAVSQKVGTQLLWDLLPFDTKEPTINPIFQTIIDPNQPLIYIGVPSEFDRKKRVNEKEAEIIKTITRYYIQMGIKKEHIGIIAPFRGQVAEISRQMGNKNNIVVDTVDRFQGSDKELIILSLCTLSPPHLLEDERRLNVALTRAKKKMIIVGDIPTEQSIPIFKELFDHIHEKYSVILIGTKKFKDVTMESRDKRKMIKKTSIEADFSHQSLSKEDLNKEYTKIIKHNICVFCQEPVLSQYILRCPICNQAYHEEHIREWLENNDVCATCQSRIRIS